MELTINEKIIDSSIELFSIKPYEDVSLLQVCKEAKISNGSFYNYFKNKEELFKELLLETSKRIEKQFAKIKGFDRKERLTDFIRLNLNITAKEKKLIKVFREGQYRFPEYEQTLRDVYMKSLTKVFGRKLTKYEYHFIMSGIRFINVKYIKEEKEVDIEFLVNRIFNGFISSKKKLDLKEIEERDYYKRAHFGSVSKKYKLLKAGESLFGESGYFNVKIKDITTEVGLSVGSFYNFFPNKEEFLRNIISSLEYEIVNLFRDNIQDDFDNSELLILYLYLLYSFYLEKPHSYTLLRDTEFVSEEFSNKVNASLRESFSFLDSEDLNVKEKELTVAFFMGIAHYMGIEFFFTKNIINFNEFLNKIHKFLIIGIK